MGEWKVRRMSKQKKEIFSKKELAKFWAIAKKISDRYGIDAKEMVYDAIREIFNKERMHDLNRHEFLLLLKQFEKMEEPTDRLSFGQKQKIYELARHLNMSSLYLRNFTKKVVGVERVEWLNWRQARTLIAALNKKKKYEKG